MADFFTASDSEEEEEDPDEPDDALPELESIKCDVAFVPVGGTYTMVADEAAALVNKIKPEVAIPIHYGSIVGSARDADTFKAKVAGGIKVVTKVEDAK